MNEDEIYPRLASRGRTFVYVFPCREEDLLKVGFSREPLERLRTLHRRFFDFFDLDRGLLVETAHLREARALERLCITTFSDARASAPLVIRSAAGGRTEWFRGISPQMDKLLRDACAAQGLTLHAPLREWLRAQFVTWSDVVYDWSAQMLDMIVYEHFNPPSSGPSLRTERVLRDALDTCLALGGDDIERGLPTAVRDWYRCGAYFARS